MAVSSGTATALEVPAPIAGASATAAKPADRVRRLGWGVADQALSSLTNFALVVMVSHESAPRTFGMFALLFAAYCVVLGISRAICCEPLTVRFSDTSKEEWQHGAALATGSALLIGLLSGAICVALGLCSGASFGGVIVVFGLAMPALLLQDTWRFAFSAAGRSRYSFMNDGLYAVVLAPLLLVLVLEGRTGINFLVAAWGTAALVAAAFGVRQAHLLPRPRHVLAWWRLQSDLAPRYLVEFLALSGECQMVIFGIALVTSLAGVAAIRGGLVLLGPLNIVMYAAVLSAVPEAVRLLRGGHKKLEVSCAMLSTGLALMTLMWIGLLLALPSSLGRELFGPIWSSARPVVLPLGLGIAAIGVLTGAGVGLRALADAKRSLRARIVVSPVIMLTVLIGALTKGPAGGAWGLAIGQGVAAAVFWAYFLRGTRDLQLSRSTVPNPTAHLMSGAPRKLASPVTPARPRLLTDPRVDFHTTA